MRDIHVILTDNLVYGVTALSRSDKMLLCKLVDMAAAGEQPDELTQARAKVVQTTLRAHLPNAGQPRVGDTPLRQTA